MPPRGGYGDDAYAPQSMRELYEWKQHAQLEDSLCNEACWARPKDEFRAGSITEALGSWRDVLRGKDWPLPLSLWRCDMLRWFTEGVNVYDFRKPFTGISRGAVYDSVLPPAYFETSHVPDATARRS